MPPSLLSPLARWVSRLSYEAIPQESLRAARTQTLNLIAALHAAARSPETGCLAKGSAAFSARGRATVLATGEKRPPHDAAMINAAYSIAHDDDDIVWMGHTGHSAVFASLAMAEHLGKNGRDFLTAVVAANEVAGRIGASCFFGPLNGQMWTFIHLAGAAAAAAKLLGLSEEETTHALGIALSQPNFPLQPGFLRPTSKFLAAAVPTATGIQAAFFAQAGMTGAPDILEARRGFWKRFSYLPLPSLLEGLGRFWVIQTLTIKTFPACHYFQTACSALTKLQKIHGPLSEKDVTSVTIETTKLACEVTRFAEDLIETGPLTPVGINFHLPMTAAVLLHAGNKGPSEVTAAWLKKNEKTLKRWRQKISIRHNPSFTARLLSSAWKIPGISKALTTIGWKKILELRRRYREEYESSLFEPAEFLRGAGELLRKFLSRSPSQASRRSDSAVPLYFPNRVTIRLKDGRTLISEVDLPVGSFCLPEAGGELREKFVGTLGRTVGRSQAQKLFKEGLNLEKIALGRWIGKVVKF